jgi:hypothetical protein
MTYIINNTNNMTYVINNINNINNMTYVINNINNIMIILS